MTGGTIGYDTSKYGGVAFNLFLEANDSTAPTFTLNGGTLVTHSNSSYAGRTVHTINGTFNYKSGTITADGTNSEKAHVWKGPGTTFNNTSGVTSLIIK